MDEDLQKWSDAYNEKPEAVEFTGKSLLRNEVVNLHARDVDDEVAVHTVVRSL